MVTFKDIENKWIVGNNGSCWLAYHEPASPTLYWQQLNRKVIPFQERNYDKNTILSNFHNEYQLAGKALEFLLTTYHTI